MILKDIITIIEKTAPLNLQDGFDNSGLQVGQPSQDVSSVLVCLDVTEEILEQAVHGGYDLVLSHHPLLFHPLKSISDANYQQRCVRTAVSNGIAIYSAHTSLDNAPGGVNHRIADIIGIRNLEWLSPKDGLDAGSGVIGELETPTQDKDFLNLLKSRFRVTALRHSRPDGRTIKRVAICGGAGAFLLPDAINKGADCFVCGEFHYHDYFENGQVLLAELGHWQSEQFTCELLRNILAKEAPALRTDVTDIITNPIEYR